MRTLPLAHWNATMLSSSPCRTRISWVDADGQRVPADTTRDGAVALLGADSGVRVWLSRDASVPTVDAISPGARVALANARLNAVIKARVADVQGSRRRILRASHAERQQIARDLHDGAQQRLITASLHLSVAAGELPTPVLEEARTAIGAALERLRRLAHGLVPGAPADGLRAALEDLVRESEVASQLSMEDIPVDDDVAVALHAAVRSVLALAGRDVRVEVVRLDAGRIGLRMEVRGLSGLDDWDEVAVADLIGAVGGSMGVRKSSRRLVVSVELPCVS
jgi:signal transduction histidine kinase